MHFYIRHESTNWPDMHYVAYTQADGSDGIRFDRYPVTAEDEYAICAALLAKRQEAAA